MHNNIILEEFLLAQQVLQDFVTNEDNISNIETAGKAMVNALRNGNKIFSCGNGGSMCDAMHFAEELSGKFRNERAALPAIAISDPGFISCTANDYGYDHVFARYLQALGKPGDVLLAISTSGNSKNVLEAARTARASNIVVISLTGNDGGLLKPLSDIAVNVAYQGYADRIQEIHIKIIHSLIHFVEKDLFFPNK